MKVSFKDDCKGVLYHRPKHDTFEELAPRVRGQVASCTELPIDFLLRTADTALFGNLED